MHVHINIYLVLILILIVMELSGKHTGSGSSTVSLAVKAVGPSLILNQSHPQSPAKSGTRGPV